MVDTGNDYDRRLKMMRRFAPARLKLYKKPKPGREGEVAPSEEEGYDAILNPKEEGEEERGGHPAPPEVFRQWDATAITAVVLFLVLGAILGYIFYEPGPPPVGDATDVVALTSLCQQGNGVACGMVANLHRRGEEGPGVAAANGPDGKTAFVYARLGCIHGSAFGCFFLWYQWAQKDAPLLKPPDAAEALRKCCEAKSPLCCHLGTRFVERTAISPEELRDAIAAFRSEGKERYAAGDEEQRLFERFFDGN